MRRWGNHSIFNKDNEIIMGRNRSMRSGMNHDVLLDFNLHISYKAINRKGESAVLELTNPVMFRM